MCLVLQSSIPKFEIFKEYPENELSDAIKSSSKRELIIFRFDSGFYKLEGKRQNCTKEMVEVKILAKKNQSEDKGPKLSKTEQLMLFKEWFDKNKRQPQPFEMYEGMNLYKFYEKCSKDKRDFEEMAKILTDIFPKH